MLHNPDRNWQFLGIVPQDIPHNMASGREDGIIHVVFGNSAARISMQEDTYRDFPASLVNDFLAIDLKNPKEKAHQIDALQATAKALGLPAIPQAANIPAALKLIQT